MTPDSDESHFNVSLIVRDKVTRQCPQTTTFEEKGEPKRIRTEVPLFTSLTIRRGTGQRLSERHTEINMNDNSSLWFRPLPLIANTHLTHCPSLLFPRFSSLGVIHLQMLYKNVFLGDAFWEEGGGGGAV